MESLGERDFLIVPELRNYHSFTVFIKVKYNETQREDLDNRLKRFKRYMVQDVITWTKPLFTDLSYCYVKRQNSSPDEHRNAISDVFLERGGQIYAVTVNHTVSPNEQYNIHGRISEENVVVPVEFVTQPAVLPEGKGFL